MIGYENKVKKKYKKILFEIGKIFSKTSLQMLRDVI